MPVPRTGTKYMAVPSHNQIESMSLIMVMRDILKLVKTKKELKKILNEKKVIVNGKIINETNYPLTLFDSLAIPSVKKFYKVNLKNKYELNPVAESETHSRIFEVIGKKLLPGKKIQFNLSQGRNMISNEKMKVGDYVSVEFAKNKILKVISLDKGVEVIVIAGKHAGKEGKIKEIITSGDQKVAVIKAHNDEIKSNVKNIFVKE